MTDLTALALDGLIFIGLAWTAWRVLRPQFDAHGRQTV